MGTDTAPITEHGVATLPEQAWERARRRAEIIGPLAQSETVGHEAADVAAQALGLSRRQVYVLIRRARQGSGLVTDFALGFTPISRTHLISPIMGTEVCHGNKKKVLCGVQARSC